MLIPTFFCLNGIFSEYFCLPLEFKHWDLSFAETHGDQGGSAERTVSCNFEEGNGRLARLCKLSRDLATLGLCTAACHDKQIGQVWSPCGTALAWGGVYETRNNDTRVGTLWKSCWATEPKPPKPFDGACGWGPNLATRELQPSKATLESQGPALSQTISPSVLKKWKKNCRDPLHWTGWMVRLHTCCTQKLFIWSSDKETLSLLSLSECEAAKHEGSHLLLVFLAPCLQSRHLWAAHSLLSWITVTWLEPLWVRAFFFGRPPHQPKLGMSNAVAKGDSWSRPLRTCAPPLD